MSRLFGEKNLTPDDATHLYVKENYIIGVCELHEEAEFSMNEFRQRIVDRVLLKNSKLSRRVVRSWSPFSAFRWENVQDFRLERHVTEDVVSGTRDADVSSYWSQYANSLHMNPVIGPTAQPLWRAHLVHFMSNASASAATTSASATSSRESGGGGGGSSGLESAGSGLRLRRSSRISSRGGTPAAAAPSASSSRSSSSGRRQRSVSPELASSGSGAAAVRRTFFAVAIHHCVADGASALQRLLLPLCDNWTDVDAAVEEMRHHTAASAAAAKSRPAAQRAAATARAAVIVAAQQRILAAGDSGAGGGGGGDTAGEDVKRGGLAATQALLTLAPLLLLILPALLACALALRVHWPACGAGGGEAGQYDGLLRLLWTSLLPLSHPFGSAAAAACGGDGAIVGVYTGGLRSSGGGGEGRGGSSSADGEHGEPLPLAAALLLLLLLTGVALSVASRYHAKWRVLQHSARPPRRSSGGDRHSFGADAAAGGGADALSQGEMVRQSGAPAHQQQQAAEEEEAAAVGQWLVTRIYVVQRWRGVPLRPLLAAARAAWRLGAAARDYGRIAADFNGLLLEELRDRVVALPGAHTLSASVTALKRRLLRRGRLGGEGEVEPTALASLLRPRARQEDIGAGFGLVWMLPLEREFTVDELQCVSRRLGLTLNDVLTAGLLAGLRRYGQARLAEQAAQQLQQGQKQRVLSDDPVRIIFPVNLRPLTTPVVLSNIIGGLLLRMATSPTHPPPNLSTLPAAAAIAAAAASAVAAPSPVAAAAVPVMGRAGGASGAGTGSVGEGAGGGSGKCSYGDGNGEEGENGNGGGGGAGYGDALNSRHAFGPSARFALLVGETLRASKHSLAPLLNLYFMRFGTALLPGRVAEALSSMVMDHTTFIFTNARGPPPSTSLLLGGRPMKSFHVFCRPHGRSAGLLSALSLHGRLHMTVTTNNETIPSAPALLTHIYDELHQLQAEVAAL